MKSRNERTRIDDDSHKSPRADRGCGGRGTGTRRLQQHRRRERHVLQWRSGLRLGCPGLRGAVADTPNYTIAMITHETPGDTFWDKIKAGAQAAAAKDNITLKYSNDPQAVGQATLIQNAVDSEVDGIATTLVTPDALAGAVKTAVDARSPSSGSTPASTRTKISAPGGCVHLRHGDPGHRVRRLGPELVQGVPGGHAAARGRGEPVRQEAVHDPEGLRS